MKKYLIILLTVISTTAFIGCSSDDDFTPPNYVTFEGTKKAVSVKEDGSESLEVTLYTANITGGDRTFSINVDDASTLDASAYTIPSSVTVPSNTNEATFNVDIKGSGIKNSGDKLVLSLGQESELHTGKPISIDVAKVCDFDVAGSYSNNSEYHETELPATIVAGEGANQYVAKDLFEEGFDINFTVNADGSISVPKQAAWISGQYGQASVTGKAGSKVQPCSGMLTLVLEHTVDAGSFGAMTEVLTKGADSDSDNGTVEEETEEDSSEE